MSRLLSKAFYRLSIREHPSFYFFTKHYTQYKLIISGDWSPWLELHFSV